MLSGRETLGHLSSTLTAARRELERLDRELQVNSDALAQNRQREARALKQLAGIRLDAIQQGELARRIDAADHRVKDTLAQRESALVELNQNAIDARQNLSSLEARRETMHDAVDVAAKTLAVREADVQTKLEDKPAFQAQLEKTRDADAIAVSAMEKSEIAVEDRREKGEPYEGDELFMYLWRRHYGTSDYRANPLARLLDAWVAKLCNYKDARPNYWMLLEIPKRLKDHAERVQRDAEKEVETLQALERTAADQGGVTDARAALVDAENKQDALDEHIAEAEQAAHKLQYELSRFAAGEDSYIANCLEILSEAMEQRDILELTRLASATMTTEDDAIVDELRHIREKNYSYQIELERSRELHQAHVKRVQELEQVRHRFKRNRYDDLRSGFNNGDLIKNMMREVLVGALRGNTLWDVLKRQQRYNDVSGAWPDFGSGGIPRMGRRPNIARPTWHWPGRSQSNNRGGFRLPRSRSRSTSRGRGGFRTGGGI
ncbi:MAG: hypothetical protein OER97_04910 [Gammaproteobacteria bacterium]|nr:hypothetical protein [Gammaproteobacteria bacterium]